MTNTVILLPDTEGKFTATGEKVRADQWTHLNNRQYTIAIYLNNFKGRVWIEASLASDPDEGDWFPIHLNGNIPYAGYPKSISLLGESGVDAYTFIANIIWIRAKMDRGDVLPNTENPYPQLNSLGNVKQIIMSY